MVISLAGRDKGKIAAVVSADGNFVMIADGRIRKTEAPKKKKLKHIRIIAGVDEKLTRLDPEKLTNRLIRERVSEIEKALGTAV
jgi:ribosomal protein L14E/L6E/L27E